MPGVARGIRVNAIAPGPVDMAMAKKFTHPKFVRIVTVHSR